MIICFDESKIRIVVAIQNIIFFLVGYALAHFRFKTKKSIKGGIKEW